MIKRRASHRIDTYANHASNQNVSGEPCGAVSAHLGTDVDAAWLVAFLLAKGSEAFLSAYFNSAGGRRTGVPKRCSYRRIRRL
ncbi:hypothetical protein MESS2_1250008 [Mesorhizobium metallidurans STM 2683]|uniref:Uncharacterized protein n=1 Tax=Mesorhizobium metallidurans STM 2683 TaxID=1297569 RepID=M5EJH4_9HYPH|nr:hypothetical protein MESS2_1250008 [Mesorhizobium metallidurans STM 2683]